MAPCAASQNAGSMVCDRISSREKANTKHRLVCLHHVDHPGFNVEAPPKVPRIPLRCSLLLFGAPRSPAPPAVPRRDSLDSRLRQRGQGGAHGGAQGAPGRPEERGGREEGPEGHPRGLRKRRRLDFSPAVRKAKSRRSSEKTAGRVGEKRGTGLERWH